MKDLTASCELVYPSLPKSKGHLHLKLRFSSFLLTLLLIEFLDEFVYGAREAAWPLIRDDLSLSYIQVGLLLGLPNIIASAVDPLLGILADTDRRPLLILSGGFLFALACLLTALSTSFWWLFLAFSILYAASGAFVSISQASLMDAEPTRREINMARWAFMGSLGVVAGPLALSAVTLLGGSWRLLFGLFSVLAVLALLQTRRHVQAGRELASVTPAESLKTSLKRAVAALKNREVLRWLTLLEFSNLMLDILLGFLALYFVDIVGATPAQAGAAVAIWSVAGLIGDFLVIPLLEKVPGLKYLRWSVIVELALFPLFLLIPGLWFKYILIALLGLFNAGWYPILKSQLYEAMPGKSGAVITLGGLFGIGGQLLPLGIGFAAQAVGLATAMWIFLLGPVVLWFGIPGRIKIMMEEMQ